METQWTRMTANEAAEIIQHNDMVAFSGFTPAGRRKPYPPRLPAELTNSMRPKSRIKFAF
ncbi:Putative acetyl-CoA hydrolase/transferase [Escherichia coli]|nr:Propionyl-CoA:succinyl-CoA transferase [Escherichia coli CE516]